MNKKVQLPALGVVGVGQLAEFMIRGLRSHGWRGKIFLSPRNTEVATKLARACQCTVGTSNQAAIEQADIVILAVRPSEVKEALSSISLQPRQTLLSVVAGLPIAHLEAQLAAGQHVVRALPVSSAEFGASPTMMYPADAAVESLFKHTGNSIVLTRESDFEIFSPISEPQRKLTSSLTLILPSQTSCPPGRTASTEKRKVLLLPAASNT